MKRLVRILLIVVCMLLSNMNFCFAEETVRLTNGEWEPYFSATMEHYGIGSRIVTEAFALEGIKVIYGFYPWKRALQFAKEGAWDGTVGWEMNADREPYFYASNPVWETPWVFFHMKKYPFDWKTLDDLKNIRIGGTLGYMYTIEFLDAERLGKIKVDRGASSDQQGFKKLLAGRFDIFPQLIDVGYHQLNKLYDAETVKLFTHHPTPFGKHTEHLLLTKKHKRNQRLIQIFNRGLQRLKESSKYQQDFEELRKEEKESDIFSK